MSAIAPIELRSDYRISTIIAEVQELTGAGGIAEMTAAFDAGVTTFDIGDLAMGADVVTGAFLENARHGRGAEAARRIGIHATIVPERSTIADFGQSQVEASVDRSLVRLGIERLDLLQLHWPDYEHPGCLDALAQLSLLQKKGKVRYVGLANFDLEHIRMFLGAGVDIVTAKVSYSLIDRRPTGAFVDFCHENDIAVFAADALLGGFLSERWLGAADPGRNTHDRALRAGRQVIASFGGWALFQELLLAMQSIAARHGTTIDDIAFRTVHDHVDPAAVLLDAGRIHRAVSRMASRDFVPTERDRDVLAQVLCRKKGPSGPIFGIERARAGGRASPVRTKLKTRHG